MENFILKLLAATYVVAIFVVEEKFLDIKWPHLLLLPLVVVIAVLIILAVAMII